MKYEFPGRQLMGFKQPFIILEIPFIILKFRTRSYYFIRNSYYRVRIYNLMYEFRTYRYDYLRCFFILSFNLLLSKVS